jgi:type VI secretion system secreted protein Hcp
VNPISPNRERTQWRASTGLRWLAVAILLVLPWVIIESPGAVSMYLKLDDLKGEAIDDFHKGEIDILAFSFDANSTHTIFGAGKSEVGNLDLIKFTDIATPELIRRVLTGEPFKEGKFSFIEVFQGKEQPVVTFTLNDILISSHTSGSNGGEDRLTEKIGLNFANFTYQTFSYSDIGEKTADPSVTWDIVENTGSIGGSANSSPALTSIANQVLNEDSAVTVPFTISDGETPTGALILSRSTTAPTIVPISGIAFGGSGSDRNVTITPTPERLRHCDDHHHRDRSRGAYRQSQLLGDRQSSQ